MMRTLWTELYLRQS